MGIILDNSTKIVSPNGVFGEVMVAEQTPEIQLIYSHGLNSEMLITTVTGSGTSSVSSSLLNVATSTTTGTSLIKSKQTIEYTAGVGVQALFTAIFQTGTGNTKQHIGLANIQDGFLVGYENEVFGIVYRKNSINTFIPQSTFSHDKLDGTGSSTMNIDVTKGNLFKIEFQYLGFGDIFFYIKNQIDNSLILFHKISYANQNITPSVLIPYYKLWAYVENTSNPSVAVVLKTASFSASHQGKRITKGRITNIRNVKIGVTTETNLFTIKNRSTINGVNNFIPVELKQLSLASGLGNTVSTIRLVLNATVGGTPVFTDINTTNSVLQRNTAGTTVTGGTELISFNLGRDGMIQINLEDYDLDLEPNDTLTVAVSTTNSTSFAGSLTVREKW